MRKKDTCGDCGIKKTPENTWYKNKEHTGLCSRCKMCAKAASRRSYQKNIYQQRERHRKKAELYRNTPGGVRVWVMQGARERGLEFDLDKSFFEENWQKPCHYCGIPLEKVSFDRVDNTVGYVKANVVVCCPLCNWMKRDLTQEAFYKHIKKIQKLIPNSELLDTG